MKHGKTIRIFLLDGDPNGRMSCELSNWSGKAYKIPRIKIKECVDREDLKGTGVYLLFGKDDDSKDRVYIGEAESVLTRLIQQIKDKEFWFEAIIFVSKDRNLNKALIKYLENRLYEIAKSTNRYSIDNNTIPTQSAISESDIAEMEEFIEYIKILVNTLGHKVFEEKREVTTKQKQNVFYIKAARGADGSGLPTSEGFVVFKGSKIAHPVVDSYANNFITLRDRLINEGVINYKENILEFVEDYIFSSSSTAAAIIMGRDANGLVEWKNKDGKQLRDI